jgi:hypothetical protein
MPRRQRKRRLWDTYRFSGFSPSPTVSGIFGDPQARVITLTRRSKKHVADAVAGCITVGTIGRRAACAISRVAIAGSISISSSGAWPAGAVAR